MIKVEITAETETEYKHALFALVQGLVVQAPAAAEPAPKLDPIEREATAEVAPDPVDDLAAKRSAAAKKSAATRAANKAAKVGAPKEAPSDRAAKQLKFGALAAGTDEEYAQAIKILEDNKVEHFSELTDEAVEALSL